MKTGEFQSHFLHSSQPCHVHFYFLFDLISLLFISFPVPAKPYMRICAYATLFCYAIKFLVFKCDVCVTVLDSDLLLFYGLNNSRFYFGKFRNTFYDLAYFLHYLFFIFDKQVKFRFLPFFHLHGQNNAPILLYLFAML